MKNKERLMLLLNYLKENSNEDNVIKCEDIIKYLEFEGISVERKTVYNDIKTLNSSGYTIESAKNGYFFVNEQFELAELRLLVDSIKANSFLSQKKSNQLQDKLLGLTNKYDRKMINSGIYNANKSINDYVLYNIDKVMHAIDDKQTIKFDYYDIDPLTGKKKYRCKNGKINKYYFIPYGLVADGNRYYAIGLTNKHETLSTYCVDKMDNIENSSAAYKEINVNINEYMQKVVGMFSGETESVSLWCEVNQYDYLRNQFGDNIIIDKVDKQGFTCNVRVAISPTFYSWVFTFGGKIKILAPEKVKQEYINMCLDQINITKNIDK